MNRNQKKIGGMLIFLACVVAIFAVIARHAMRGNTVSEHTKNDDTMVFESTQVIEVATESEGKMGLSSQERVPDIMVTEEELIIPGIEGEYQLLLISDQHIAIKTHEYIDDHLGYADERMFRNANGTTAADQFVQWIELANENQYDALLMCGDMIDYYTPTNAQFLYECVSQFQMPYLYTLGNHEMYDPYGYGISDNSPFWKLFQEGNVNFQMLELKELVICSIRDEGYEVNYDVLDGMERAITLGKPIIVIAHVPFYNENVEELMEQSAQAWGKPLIIGPGALGDTWVTNEFLDMILQENSNVVAVVTGDNHFYYKGNLSDNVTEWVLAPGFAGNGTVITVKGE